ncbi:hypothetical protein C6497_17260 [Candidatus Poribacteria bacterium]|nr:MAG: hypothetical protein C6497_17260 [Candidatus Poribacteria bacterium]
MLCVKAIEPNTKPGFKICENIRNKLEKTTNLSFYVSDSVRLDGVDFGKVGTYFTLRLRITSNPEKCGGRPCIRGMRIRVTDVLDLLASGLSFKEILEEMPDLNSDDIVACLKYASHKIDPPMIRKGNHPVITV